MKSNSFEDDGEFYLCLSSNSSSKFYANSPSNFRVQLPLNKELDGKWEVALAEIDFPFNWYNITKTKLDFYYIYHAPNITQNACAVTTLFYEKLYHQLVKERYVSDRTGGVALVSLYIGPGYYPDMKSVCAYANALLLETKAKDYVEFRLTAEDKRLQIKFLNGGALVIAQNASELSHTLGLATNDFVNGEQVYYSPVESYKQDSLSRFDLQTPALFVYTDIIDYQIVGDVLAPLLRTVPVKGDRGKAQHVEFLHRIWLAVNKGYINSIELRICNDAGELISFPSGKVTIVLQFRRAA